MAFSLLRLVRYFALTLSFVASFVHRTRAFTLETTGTTVSLNHAAYYVPPAAVATIPLSKAFQSAVPAGSFMPLAVITTDSVAFSDEDLSKLASTWTAVDDVFQEGFLGGALISFSRSSPAAEAYTFFYIDRSILSQYGGYWILTATQLSTCSTLEPPDTTNRSLLVPGTHLLS